MEPFILPIMLFCILFSIFDISYIAAQVPLDESFVNTSMLTLKQVALITKEDISDGDSSFTDEGNYTEFAVMGSIVPGICAIIFISYLWNILFQKHIRRRYVRRIKLWHYIYYTANNA